MNRPHRLPASELPPQSVSPQNHLSKKCAMSSIRSTNPLMKMTNLAVNFGELISFLSIEQEYPRASWPIPSGKPKLGVPTLSPDLAKSGMHFPEFLCGCPTLVASFATGWARHWSARGHCRPERSGIIRLQMVLFERMLAWNQQDVNRRFFQNPIAEHEPAFRFRPERGSQPAPKSTLICSIT